MTDQPPNGFMGSPPPNGGPQFSFKPAEEEPRSGYMDHEERARIRMAEIRQIQGDIDDDSDDYHDKFYAEAPPGWSYEWKNHTIFNKEFPHYTATLMRNGWSPVPAHRHRELLYAGYSDDSVIIDGMILMERPMELTKRRRLREIRKATDQVRSSEAKLAEAPPGTAPRDRFRETLPRVGSMVGPIGIPD